MRHATLLVSSFIATMAVAQDYLANDPVWTVHSVCGVPAPCIANDTYNYYTAGDSVIDGTTWTKVLRVGSYTLSWQGLPPSDPSCQGLHPYGPANYGVKLIRQEGRQLRILDGTDQLLHEFDLVVGQTLPISSANWNASITVLAVDSVLIGSEMRARYQLANSWAQYLIEGVGSSHGLFEPLSDFFDCGFSLDCFGLGSESYYPTAGGTCWLVMGVGRSQGLEQVQLSPNPASESVMLSGLEGVTEVTVHDAFGRLVHRQRASGTNVTMDVSQLPEGCYTVVADQRVHRMVVAR